MKHEVKVYKVRNGKGFLTHNTQFSTAEKAYEHYVRCCEVAKKTTASGETFMVMRYNDGDLMTLETIEG